VIIGLSANSDSKTIEEALGVGMDDFLAKPLAMTATKRPGFTTCSPSLIDSTDRLIVLLVLIYSFSNCVLYFIY